METTVFVGLIALLGPILGFTASFVLQAWQRKWTLDDQRRKWKRRELEEISKTYKGIAEFVSKVRFAGIIISDDKMEYEKIESANATTIPPFRDEELFDLQGMFIDVFREIFEGESKIEEKSEQFKVIISIGREFQERINTLLEETYK